MAAMGLLFVVELVRKEYGTTAYPSLQELLRNLLYNSAWLEQPDLVEIRSVNVATGAKEQRRLFEYQLKVRLKQPVAPAAAASAASAPLPAKAS